MRTAELQDRLRWLGLDPGPSDGVYGELTEEAVFDALDKYSPAPPVHEGLLPASWMPECNMLRLICHWTAGAHKASSHDVQYYHILIENDGTLVRGKYSIKDNENTADGVYAPHTKNLNTGSIGVALCGMAEASENPFSAGAYPLTQLQVDTLAAVVGELCVFYGIPVSRETVLSHAEVQPTLGVAQSGKWDINWIPGMPGPGDPVAVGDTLRALMLDF